MREKRYRLKISPQLFVEKILIDSSRVVCYRVTLAETPQYQRPLTRQNQDARRNERVLL